MKNRPMNLPAVVADLVKAQDDFDSVAYANCFSEAAVVHDEGRTHLGRTQIRAWISEANGRYGSVMKPIRYMETEAGGVLTAEISGSFVGSPVVLNYRFQLKGNLIQTLEITA